MKSKSRKLTSKFFKGRKLSIEEEQELATKIHSGDQDESYKAFEKLVLSNIKLVIAITREFMNKGVEFEDIVSEGIVGLMDGARHFLPSKGAKFSTYVSYWIRNRIQRFLPNGRRTISIPRRHVITRSRFMEFMKQHEKDMNLEEMAKATNHWLALVRQMKDPIKILPLKKDDYGNYYSYDEKGFFNDKDEILNVLMSSKDLSDVEKTLLVYRFGLNGEESNSLEELASCFGRSRERMRQIENEALRKLKEKME